MIIAKARVVFQEASEPSAPGSWLLASQRVRFGKPLKSNVHQTRPRERPMKMAVVRRRIRRKTEVMDVRESDIVPFFFLAVFGRTKAEGIFVRRT